jgi:hypothetical protein
MKFLSLLPLLLFLGCPKEIVVVEIPGRSCNLRLNLVQAVGSDALRSDLPGDEGSFSAIDLRLTAADGAVIERRLTDSDTSGSVARFAEPVAFEEGDRFDLELLVRSPSGRVFSLGRRKGLGCGTSENEVIVDLPLLPVNRWVELAAPQVARFGHASMTVGAGALLVGGRKTPRAFAASANDAGPSADAGVALDAAAGVDAGQLLPEAGPSEDAGAGEAPSCEPSLSDALLGEPAAASVIHFDRYTLRFSDSFEQQSRRDLAQIPSLVGSALFHQQERQRVLLLGGVSIFGRDNCELPPAAQFHIFDYSDPSKPSLSSLTWGEDQRGGHLALQHLSFAQAIPVDHELIDVALMGGYWGRPQVAPQADWPPRHDPPGFSMPHRMAVVNSANFVSRRDTLRAPWAGGDEIRLPFQPSFATFGDGSAILFGGWSVDRSGVTGSSDEVYQLLRSNQATEIELEVPHLYAKHSLALTASRAHAQALNVSDRLVLVLGGLDGQSEPALPSAELYKWTPGGRPGFFEGGTLEHLAIDAQGEAQIRDRGFAALVLPCEGSQPCPILVVGGESVAGNASDRALILNVQQVDRNGQLSWRLVAEALGVSLPEPHWGASLNLLDDGSYLVLGGRSAPPGDLGAPLQTALIYQPYTP